MDSSLHQGISTNESTHCQGYHTHLSVFIKKSTIHTGAADVQLGAVIMQEVKPLAFHYKKSPKTQINHAMT